MALPDTLPTLLNAEQVAEYLGLHKVTVLRFARAGKLPGLKVGREWRFQADDMRAWLAARRDARADPVARSEALLDRLGEGIRTVGHGTDDIDRVIAEVRAERQAEREAFFTFIGEIRERNRGVDPEELARDIAEAVQEARRKHRLKTQT